MRKSLGERIKHYRELRGMTQKALGDALNADKGTIWRWEGGRSWPEFPALQALCKVLEIRVDQLFENVGAPPEMTSDQVTEMAGRLRLLELVPVLDQEQVSRFVRLIETELSITSSTTIKISFHNGK